jgi:DNA-directed RNA polymerase subunit RPC12/RpoP
MGEENAMGWFSKLFGGGGGASSGEYTFSRKCSQCGKTLEKYQGGFGGMAMQSEGVNCPNCRKTWCNGCHPPSRGQQCQKCGGQLRCNFG